MSLAPASVFDRLFDQVLSLPDPSSDGFAFASARLKQELDKYENTNPAKAYCLRGMIACIEGDMEAMKRFHEAAIHEASDATLLHMANVNYSVSLRKSRLFYQSYSYARVAYDLAPTEVDTLTNSYYCSITVGRFQEGYEYIKDVEVDNLADDVKENVLAFLAFYSSYKENNIQDQEMADAISSAFEMVNNETSGHWDFDLKFEGDPSGDGIVAVFEFDILECEGADELEGRIYDFVCQTGGGHQLSKSISVEIINNDMRDVLEAIDQDIESGNVVELEDDFIEGMDSLLEGVVFE